MQPGAICHLLRKVEIGQHLWQNPNYPLQCGRVGYRQEWLVEVTDSFIFRKAEASEAPCYDWLHFHVSGVSFFSFLFFSFLFLLCMMADTRTIRVDYYS